MRTKTLKGILGFAVVTAVTAVGCIDADAEFDANEEAATAICKAVEREPNGREGTALKLPSSNDCDGHGDKTTGMLAGSDDADWHWYEGYDVGYCYVNPTVTLETQDPSVRVCTFFDCVDDAETTVECPSGSTPETSPEGRKGCCAGAGELKVRGVDCEWTAYEDIDVFIRVDRTDRAATCVEYAFSYHY
jgi:hypothetical protein